MRVLAGAALPFGPQLYRELERDQAVQFQIAVVMDLTLTRHDDGKVLWHVRGLKETDEYSASAPVVVTSSSQFQQGTLNASDVNTASHTELENVPGIGPSIAERIIEARPFKSADDLQRVKGIGAGKRYEKIRPFFN